MRYVSYTRGISGCLALDPPKDVIKQQNEMIKEFVQDKGWKLDKKYSDRKQDREEDTAFLQMKQDGMDRKYDCIVVSSMYYCGKNYTAAYDLLFTILYPVGIHFAVAEDGFCSSDATPEEVENYFNKYRSLYFGDMASKRVSSYSANKAYLKYGYVWVADEELQIDPEPAAVIKNIFEMSANGMSMKEIAKELNARKILSPMQYRKKMHKRENQFTKYGWTASSVSVILERTTYIGRWERCIRGNDITLPCPAIVSRELWDTVRNQIQSRDRAKMTGQKKIGRRIFAKKIFDKDTGSTLNVYSRSRDGEKIYRFRYPAPVTDYQILHIECEEVERMVCNLLRQNHDQALFFKKWIARYGEAEKERQISCCGKEMLIIYEKMMETESEIVAVSRAFEQGALSRECYEQERRMLLSEQEELDKKLSEIMEEVNKIKICFSNKNPWIQLFAKIRVAEPLTFQIVTKYIEKVFVCRFEQVELLVKEQEWRDRLCEALFEEGMVI